MEESSWQEAIRLLEKTLQYPPNLGEGKLPNVPDNEAYYRIGKAYRALGEEEKAKTVLPACIPGGRHPFQRALLQRPALRIISIIWDWHKENWERKIWQKKPSIGSFPLGSAIFSIGFFMTFFAVSPAGNGGFSRKIWQLRNTQYCKYLMALGDLGLSRKEEAGSLAEEILQVWPDDQGADTILRGLKVTGEDE